MHHVRVAGPARSSVKIVHLKDPGEHKEHSVQGCHLGYDQLPKNCTTDPDTFADRRGVELQQSSEPCLECKLTLEVALGVE